MKNSLILILLIAGFAFNSYGQSCAESAKVVAPVISESARKVYEANLTKAIEELKANPGSADAMIWHGRRIAYLGKYKEAIGIFSDGVTRFPKDARFYRHRGHRYLTIRCFDDAVRDFETAARLVKGKADEIEPDGLPNARNIPTSTLQSNIFYHLGLAHYFKGDFKKVLKAFRECEKVSTNPDMKVATIHWLYMALRRLGRNAEATRSVAGVAENLEIIENDDYYKLVKLYKGSLRAPDLDKELGADADSLGSASLGYGIGNWYLYNGDREKAVGIFRKITAGNQWASFGFIAAERELAGR